MRDVHRHLGGSPARAAAQVTNLKQLLTAVHLEERRQREPGEFEAALNESILGARREGLSSVTIRFNPLKRGRGITEAAPRILSSSADAGREVGIEVDYILCMDRLWCQEMNRKVLDLAILWRQGGVPVTGIDMAGPDEGREDNPGWWRGTVGIFELARDLSLKSTYHIGESTSRGVDSVIRNLWWLDGIGHGIQMTDDQLWRLSRTNHGVTFEICPTANIKSGLATLPDLKRFLVRLKAMGFRHYICTDNPGVLGTTISRETDLMDHIERVPPRGTTP